jgi:N-succinyldiaminopimelate aminotransferase
VLADKIEQQYGLSYDPDSEITVTHGASEGIQATITALVDPGDEVIIFEPYFDTYVPNVHFVGGVPRYYQLRPPAWGIDAAELEALFSDKTKLIIVNTPHNPTGKVFTQAELQLIADLCHKYDVVALVDEVYEHLVFDDAEHVPLARLPGMRERSVTLSSLGKTFSATGWKVGWASGSAELIQALIRVRQFTTFSGAAPLQEGAADALIYAGEHDYYAHFRARYQEKRDFLMATLTDAGLAPIVPQGTYFAMVDIGALGFGDDVTFCRYLTTEVGVTAIPPSAFYSHPADGATLARFAFCKSDPVLAEAARRLKTFRP